MRSGHKLLLQTFTVTHRTQQEETEVLSYLSQMHQLILQMTIQQLQPQQSDLLGQQVYQTVELKSLTIKFIMIKEPEVASYNLQPALL
jgi:hypothetical protein